MNVLPRRQKCEVVYSRKWVSNPLTLSPRTGPFIVQNSSHPHPPPANLIAANKEVDKAWSPRVFSQFPSARYAWVDETVFVYGLYSPYHMGHWMFNGLMPLWG